MGLIDPEKREAWFTLSLTFEEAKALRGQLGDLPKRRTGPKLLELYGCLDARLRHFSDSIDDGPGRLTVVRPKPPSPPKPEPPKPVKHRARPENPCYMCDATGLVVGEVCKTCNGFGDL
jgi:hypothetical protein